ncbi:hypothetical protein A3H89_03275 [Candidatus Amesbacteria bacterium RIFCSPLOWO2_02_FULL_48_11]|uniref:Uncharacterized protein n=3 Tax=Candidatus Amesiibacteriota TaxID=1752730 RepID=A0A1F4ZDD3_9BACT|nr:MAG: hypothetical protein UY22_C0014G0003 [Candidatus Amesbacteria bacterium GW2011_GWC1_48_10]OGC90926.1 MAG: hypothetical protein A2V48_02120 [Candidatus Amesbacteria bacterium RBG_19FT_COMBO_48_16]OGC96595.1 MAG: hypothetical protein A3C34_00605 [Candidatus Amesbacteria bacterium RIFCSPHIGHO2_02_FULL_48_21]OGC97383.1 MAG: hypothetical protein A2W16_00710 [Candidatus Amesbacteria bacterium RBG_16_48_31]OGD00437.1 MAG: hypothetical protein A2702_03665 [Candidatus Amesbacteria bacterium RIFC
MNAGDQKKLKILEKKLAEYKKILEEKKRVFRGIKHENSLSELRYTQYMVYKNLVEGLEKEIIHLKKGLKVGE